MNKPVRLHPSAVDVAEQVPTQKFIFALFDGFCQIGFCAFVEALYLANQCNESVPYSWEVVSETGAPVKNSVHLPTFVNAGLEELNRHSTIVLCGGPDPKRVMSERTMAWLRRQYRKGVTCGALGSGVFTLARAGLLGGKRAVVHWEFQSAFHEYFPEVEVSDGIFLVDNPIFTSVGRAATLDLALHLIATSSGSEVSSQVAEQIVYSGLRHPGTSQRLSAQARFGSRNPKLLEALKIMSENLEAPLSPSEIAVQIGISKRQLERLFKSKIGIPPKSYYIKMRLQKARSLLLQTDLRVAEIACASGFGSLAHFSKSYQREFGVSPSKDTRALAVQPEKPDRVPAGRGDQVRGSGATQMPAQGDNAFNKLGRYEEV
ncbi:MAG: GlxA family transcriptional regulator [Pseudomonadota bacterium]